jgi:hypothetical protein
LRGDPPGCDQHHHPVGRGLPTQAHCLSASHSHRRNLARPNTGRYIGRGAQVFSGSCATGSSFVYRDIHIGHLLGRRRRSKYIESLATQGLIS